MTKNLDFYSENERYLKIRTGILNIYIPVQFQF
jgi:hypothetical protein